MLFHFSKLSCLAVSFLFISLSTSQFVTTNGLHFELAGNPFTFAGGNLWDFGATDQKYITDSITAIKQVGYSVVRVAAWIMKDLSSGLLGTFGSMGEVWFQEWQNGQPIVNTGANGLTLMDQAVQQAEAAGIKLVMCLTNEWVGYGGMMNYVNNLLGSGQSQTQFYTNPTVINSYKNYVGTIVNRYKSSPAVFAWELANEARCQESNCQGSQVMTTWADEVSQYIKSLDPQHMVTFGGYGYFNDAAARTSNGPNGWDFNYDGASGEDYDAILALKNIDFGTVHLYTDSDKPGDGPAYGLQWLKDHNAASIAANKPMIVEEMGVNRTSPDLSVPDVLNEYQSYILSAPAIQGSLDWDSLNIDAAQCPLNNNPYALCTSDPFYTQVVTSFASAMAAKGK